MAKRRKGTSKTLKVGDVTVTIKKTAKKAAKKRKKSKK